MVDDHTAEFGYGDPDDLGDREALVDSDPDSNRRIDPETNERECLESEDEIPGMSEDEEQEKQWLELTNEEEDDPEQNRSAQSLPPLSEGGARIVVVEEEDGQQVPAMVLTSQMIKEWNIILRSKRLVTGYSSKMIRLKNKIDGMETQKLAIKQQRNQLRERHKDLNDEEFAALESVRRLRASYEELAVPVKKLLQQFRTYEEKLERAEEAPRAIRAWMEKYWGFAMAEHNLLDINEDVLDSDDELDLLERQEEFDPFPIEETEPTPSEIAKEEFCSQMRETRDRIVELEEIVNNWQQHYDTELIDYLAAVEDGTCHNSRTVFDLCLLEESQEKIGELVRAEKEFDLALKEARRMGIDVDDGSLESSIPSTVEDDGYTLSFEHEMSSSVDKRWILSWAETIEYEDVDQEPDCDDWNEWEVKSLGQNERDSVIYEMKARGRMRRRIDKWRSTCEALRHPAVSISIRSSSTESVESRYYHSAESSPFVSKPTSPGSTSGQSEESRSHLKPPPSKDPVSENFSTAQSVTTPIAPAALRTYEIGVRQGHLLSPMEAVSPFTYPEQPRRPESHQDYGPFSPVDIQDDLYWEGEHHEDQYRDRYEDEY